MTGQHKYDKLENGEIDIMGDISYANGDIAQKMLQMNRWARKNTFFSGSVNRDSGTSDFKSLDGKRVVCS